MKVVHVLYSGLGGHGNVFFSMVNANKNQEYVFEAIFNGVEEIRSEYIERCKAMHIGYQYIHKNSGLDLNFYRNLYKGLKHTKPEVILVHGSSAILPICFVKIFGRGKKKIAVRETQANHLKNRKEWFWLAVSLLVANRIIFLSEEYNGQVRKKMNWIYNRKKIVVIPNGIDLELFKPRDKLVSDEIVFGMQSRLVMIKDHLTMFEAFAKLLRDTPQKRYVLKIAGDGDYKSVLEKRVKELGLEKNIQFVGVLNESELAGFLHGLDVYLHASFGETMSTAIMQAMACKKPIIASDVPGINNMIQHCKTGLLVPVKDPDAMTHAMNKLIEDSDLAKYLANNAYKKAVEKFSNELMFNQYKKFVFN